MSTTSDRVAVLLKDIATAAENADGLSDAQYAALIADLRRRTDDAKAEIAAMPDDELLEHLTAAMDALADEDEDDDA